MNIRINRDAVDYAREMVEGGSYRINSIWKNNKPTAEKIAAFAAAHGADAAARWHLAIDLDVPADSPSRLLYPIGDLTNVHDSALRAVKSRAEVDQQTELADAAEEALDVFYRMNAC
ncbi:MAG: hypothetical protein SGJ24_02800 [Chloroflexota bacterium]|nr:hypothetical protein [Chloroflexota bacterium]